MCVKEHERASNVQARGDDIATLRRVCRTPRTAVDTLIGESSSGVHSIGEKRFEYPGLAAWS
jgi:hypothetical protein